MGKGGGCVLTKKRLVETPVQRPQNPEIDRPPVPEKEVATASKTQQSGSASTQPIKNLRVFIIFYSMYGHVELLARRIKKGVDSIDGVEGVLYRVPETLPSEVLDQMRVPHKGDEVAVLSCVKKLVEADGLLFGFPTRFGVMAAQMKAFFESTSELCEGQQLAGVPAGFFVSTGTQGGGQETTAYVGTLFLS